MASSTHSIPKQKTFSVKKVQSALKRLEYLFEKKLLENKLSFWLPLRAEFMMTKSFDKVDFGTMVFDRDQLEREIASKINKVEIRRIVSP